ncbi:CaiB/BaiF CoA transferase family protein [Cupriavidus oxalaticus]|uniref:CoA transferase n=2 Tax=Cupriavidus oxalaticus TaxID=96344 RepID=A0A375FIX7_9BURK|nr:CoA transferase [Cupriavidus oxalaticus]QRQ85790.1 CoA transferase [Cupriavidus oxalaticus]QRQ92511.1 CoA transferase [Cupriavidus oxalaticus]SPC05118.1 putative acyl-CoA transferase/carnitine dehydratase [Cupriavidus oxalaticus]SPC18156.1 putative acyl-CoA transferase/carnitine dehydratase [Cupriavidus oxalaticus]
MLGESLEGLKVLDFSHVLAGPVASMTLADLGAHIVKVEPIEGEIGRHIGPPWINGQSPTFMSVNRNKHSLAVDLKSREGREAIHRMALGADVVIENFRPGVMEKLGLGYGSLAQKNPRLVYCSISAFGQKGPLSSRPGVDGIIQAVSGLMSTLGQHSSPPAKVPVPIADMLTGYLAAIAVLGALHRVRIGRGGQHLDVSLYNATVMLQQVSFAAYFASGKEPEKSGSAAPYACPNEAYPTRDGWMMVVAYHQSRWETLCNLLDFASLASDDRFSTNDSRVANREVLHQILSEKFLTRDTSEWLELLSSQDVICAPVLSYDQVMTSPEYSSSGLTCVVDHPVAGRMRTHRFALEATDGSEDPPMPAPVVGQHTSEALSLYGMTDDEIEKLIRCGVVRDASVNVATLNENQTEYP